jgi:RHS repeat-associated protein
VLEEIESHHLFEGEQRVLLVDDVITTDRKRANGTPYRKQPILRYQYGNHLGSVALELDEAALIKSYEELHPWGTPALCLMKSDTEASPRRYRYTGMERDEESGFGYHGARYLSGATSRWISIDPSGIADGLNRYRYCKCNPISNVDRLGLQAQGTVGTTSGIAASKTRKAEDIGWRLGQMAHHPEQYPTVTEETKSAMRAEMHALIMDASRLERNVGERKAEAEFGLKVTLAAGGLAVGAPAVGAAGLASAFGVGFAFSTGRQGAQVLDNQRTSISWMDSLEDAGWAGAFSVVSKVPGSKYGFAGLGVASSAHEFSEGNSFTGAFDAATSIYALRQDLFNFKLSASNEPQLGAPATQSVATLGMSIAVTSGKGSPSSPFNVLMTGQSSSLLSAWRTFVNRTLKGDAGSIHGEDQWRAGQTIITAKLELPGRGKVLVAAPNSSAGWRPGQRELAIRLGYSPIDPYSPGSNIHAEGNLQSAIGDRNSPYFGAKVLGWAISRGRTGSSVVCNEGCKNFTNLWGPQQR